MNILAMAENLSFASTFTKYDRIEELPLEDQELMKAAIEMLGSAYAPYSNFFVGAAVRTESNTIYLGCNQENASYPLCICGERVALFNAGANEPKTPIKALAIVCHNPKKLVETPVSPCGACRQVIAEFATRHKKDFYILLKGDVDDILKVKSVFDLLPFSFSKEHLH